MFRIIALIGMFVFSLWAESGVLRIGITPWTGYDKLKDIHAPTLEILEVTRRSLTIRLSRLPM